MIKEAYVSFGIAKLLKEKRYDEKTTHWYNKKGSLINDYPVSYENFYNYEKVLLAPTLQMACAWLREKHFIIVVTPVLFNVEYENSKWGYSIWADDNLEVSAEDCSNLLDTYEAATEAALKYVLENLI